MIENHVVSAFSKGLVDDELRAYAKKKILQAENKKEYLSFEQLLDYVQIKEATRISKASGDFDQCTDFSSDQAQPNNDHSRIKSDNPKPRYKPWRQDQRYDNNRSPQHNNAQQINSNQDSHQSQQTKLVRKGRERTK